MYSTKQAGKQAKRANVLLKFYVNLVKNRKISSTVYAIFLTKLPSPQPCV